MKKKIEIVMRQYLLDLFVHFFLKYSKNFVNFIKKNEKLHLLQLICFVLMKVKNNYDSDDLFRSSFK